MTCIVNFWRTFYSHTYFKPSWIILVVTRVHINLFCVYLLLFCFADSGVSLSAAGEEKNKYGALCCHAERDWSGQCNCCHFSPPSYISPSNTPARPIRSTLKNGVNLGFAGRLAAQPINDLWGWIPGQIAVITFFQTPFRATASSRWEHLPAQTVSALRSSSSTCFHMEFLYS